jgi:Family of unknown function (DUF6788)
MSGRMSATEFVKTFHKTPSLVRHPVRCGKLNCRCAKGERHEAWRLVWWDQDEGRQRGYYVRKAEVEAVRKVVAEAQAEDREARRLVAETIRELRLMHRLTKLYGLCH